MAPISLTIKFNLNLLLWFMNLCMIWSLASPLGLPPIFILPFSHSVPTTLASLGCLLNIQVCYHFKAFAVTFPSVWHMIFPQMSLWLNLLTSSLLLGLCLNMTSSERSFSTILSKIAAFLLSHFIFFYIIFISAYYYLTCCMSIYFLSPSTINKQ